MNTDAPDFNPEDAAEVEKILGGEFHRPCERFQGKDLWPFTPGSKDIFAMVTSDMDPVLYRALAFVYIHVQRGAPDMERDFALHIIPLAWENLNLFRAKVYGWRSELSEADLLRVYEIGQKELHLEALSQIVATPPEIGDTPKKKATATTRRKQAGKSSQRQSK